MNILERFLKYVSFDTKSDVNSKVKPSTEGQMKLLKFLKEEMIDLGLKQIDLDEENGILYAKIPSNINGNITKIGFIAHVDTSPDTSGKNINPKIKENYDGNDIYLNEERILSQKEFHDLVEYKNKTLVVTDGTTLLGADDKAGIAEIMTMVEYVVNHPEIKHGEICIGFTSDEEISRGTEGFDIKRFGADVAYTVDGGKIGEIAYENFNAKKAVVTIKGKSIHTGDAKDKMINASIVACEFNSKIPSEEIPSTTEGYEGFYHLDSITGEVEFAELKYNLRDFEEEGMQKRVDKINQIAENLNNKYGKEIVNVEFFNQYENMKTYLKNNMNLINDVISASDKIGISSFSIPIRGGTDGARLSKWGLPCPNLGTGGRNFHGIYEYVCVDDMKKISELLIELIKQK